MTIEPFSSYILRDETKKIVHGGINSVSLKNKLEMDQVNAALAKATSEPFITPYIGYGAVAKILAHWNIILPQHIFLDHDEDDVVIAVSHFGEIQGLDPNQDNTYYMFFSYGMNDDGYFDVVAELSDSDLRDTETEE